MGSVNNQQLQPQENKRERLRRLIEERANWQTVSYPLSEGQKALWFLYNLYPGSASYNEVMPCLLHCTLDDEALRRVCQVLIDRHPVFRTTYRDNEGQPEQVVHRSQEVAFEVISATHMTNEQCHSLIRELIGCPFNLVTGPAVRFQVIRRAPFPDLLLLTAHHIVIDGWSYAILLDELCQLMKAETTEKKAQLPPLTSTYFDYVRWQQDMLVSPSGEQLWDYWKHQLSGELPLLELPVNRPRTVLRGVRAGVCTFRCSTEMTSRLRQLAQREHVTFFTLLVASLQVLLQRYSGQDVFHIGSPSLGREKAEFASQVGYFVNPVVLRTDLSGNPTFSEHLQATYQTVCDALAHQSFPFSTLVNRLHVQRDPTRNPLFDVLIVLQNQQRFDAKTLAQLIHPNEVGFNESMRGDDPGSGLFSLMEGFDQEATCGNHKDDHLPLQLINIEQQEARFDLELEIFGAGPSLVGAFKYRTDAFDPALIQQMSEHFQILLRCLTEKSEERIGTISLLTDREAHLLLREWKEELPRKRHVHCCIEAQVEHSPDAIALVFEDVQLTFHMLNERANQQAHFLRRLGVGPEVLVGICLERSPELVVSLLAVLKAGGAYLPLDPDYPPERLAYMMNDSKLAFLITKHTIAQPHKSVSIRVIYVDTHEHCAEEPCSNPNTEIADENLMYIIYTSGSTGTPKGAQNTYQGLANRLLWMQEIYQLQPEDRVLQKTPISFDVSGWEFFWPLIAGACIVLARPGGHQDPSYLVDVIYRQQITTVHFVPSMLRMFLRTRDVARCNAIRRVICSGEVLSRELQAEFFAIFQTNLYNLYGPTEAAIDVTAWQCDPHDSRESVPIGSPISNMQIYILDRYLQPTPIGVPGELFLGGIGLARGYVNRPDLTAERFISHPFPFTKGERLYRTGDRARFCTDGTLEFLGRVDKQVKIGGVRIEPAEIEACLSKHPAIRDAVVLAQEENTGSVLIAYIVPDDETSSLTSTELRRYLSHSLPEAMIPTAFYLINTIPLTENGKLNRQKSFLQEQMSHRLVPEASFAAPYSKLEQAIAAIWSQVLQVDRIGIHDNFFDCGGSSLKLIEIHRRLQHEVGSSLLLIDLLTYPTIKLLAAYIEERLQTNVVQEGQNRGEMRVAMAQGRHVRRYARKYEYE